MSPVDQRKFRSFTDENVRRLNKVADAVIRRDFRGKVTVRRDAYNFTVNIEDEAYLRGDARHPASGALKSLAVWKFYGAFVLNRRDVLHAIDATPARWRGGAGSSPLDGARTAASSPRNDFHTGPSSRCYSSRTRATTGD